MPGATLARMTSRGVVFLGVFPSRENTDMI